MSDNIKLIKNIHAAVEDALFWGDRLTNSEFSLLMQPGQFIGTDLQENDPSDDMAIQYALTNEILDTSYLYKPLTGSISAVYDSVLRRSALPHRELTDGELIRIRELRAWLDENRASYQLLRDRFYDADEAYEQERHQQSPNGSRLRRLAEKRTDAQREWQPVRNLFNRKSADLTYIISFSPRELWAERFTKFDEQRRTSINRGDYYQVFFNPPVAAWNSAGTSWTTFEKHVSETDTYNYSRATSWSGGLSGAWGLWSWGAGTSGGSTKEREKSEISTVNIKFDYLRVRLDRPWIDDSVFHERFWTWDKQWGLARLSDGGRLTQTPPERPIGLMPFLTTHFIVAKNVELSADFKKSDREYWERHSKTKARVGWGPISVKGSYSRRESEEKVQATFNGVTFKIAQPQIIGWTGKLLPRIPDPIVSLPWDDRADLELLTDVDHGKLVREIDAHQRRLEDVLDEINVRAVIEAELVRAQRTASVRAAHALEIKELLEVEAKGAKQQAEVMGSNGKVE